MFDGTYTNPATWTAHLDPNGASSQTTRLKIFRQYALAYGTHGRPLPYVYTTPSQAQNRLIYFRPVDTSAMAPLPGSGARSDKLLLNFVNFDKIAQTVQVRITMPRSGTYVGERFGANASYSAARSDVLLSTATGNTITLTETLGPRDSVQYILDPVGGSLRASENPTNIVNGVKYKYYEGSWSALPNFEALAPVKSSTGNNFSLAPRNRTDNYGFSFEGYVEVPTDGVYTFYTNSDDGSKLFIGSRQVVDNDGLHGMQERSGTIGLKAGKHYLRAVFFQLGGGADLQVRYSGPGVAKQLIPDARLWRAR